MQKEPANAEDYKDRGDALLAKGNTGQAIADYTKAIEINPKDGEAYNNRAIMYFGEKEYTKAKEDVTKAQALGYEINPQLLENLNRESTRTPEYQALDKGGLHSDKGMHDEAIAEFDNAIQANPNSAEAYYFRAGAYAKKDDFDKAISDYTKAIEINAEYGDAYYNRALVYLAKQKYDSAWQDVHKAEKLGHKIDPAFLEKLKQSSVDTSQPENSNMEIEKAELVVNGIFVGANGKYKAIINDKTVFEGSDIGGAKIDKINQDSVDIIANGQKKKIKVGEQCEVLGTAVVPHLDKEKFMAIYRSAKNLEESASTLTVDALSSEITLAKEKLSTDAERQLLALYQNALECYQDGMKLWGIANRHKNYEDRYEYDKDSYVKLGYIHTSEETMPEVEKLFTKYEIPVPHLVQFYEDMSLSKPFTEAALTILKIAAKKLDEANKVISSD